MKIHPRVRVPGEYISERSPPFHSSGPTVRAQRYGAASAAEKVYDFFALGCHDRVAVRAAEMNFVEVSAHLGLEKAGQIVPAQLLVPNERLCFQAIGIGPEAEGAGRIALLGDFQVQGPE